MQSDNSLLLEVYNPNFETVRNELSKFAELVKSPEHIHTYLISSISIWNASASGVALEEIISTIENYSKFDVPQNVIENIKTIYQRFGKIELIKGQSDDELLLNVKEKNIELEILANPKLKKYLQMKDESGKYKISLEVRGDLKVDFFRSEERR